jgi:hypothetical protein
MRKSKKLNDSGFAILIILVMTAAWLTHVVTCIREEAWTFLVVGALFFPIAIVHGIGLWFNFW